MKRLHNSYDSLESVEHIARGNTFTIRYSKSKSLISMVVFAIAFMGLIYGFYSILESKNVLDEYFINPIKIKHFIGFIGVLSPLIVLCLSIYKYLKRTEHREYLYIDLDTKLIRLPYQNYEEYWSDNAPMFHHTKYRADQNSVSEFNLKLQNGERLPILNCIGYCTYYSKLEKAIKSFGLECERVVVDERSKKKEKTKGLSYFFLIAGIPFLIFGIVAFSIIGSWGKQWEERKDLVNSGQIPEQKATITKKFISKNRSFDNVKIDHVVVLKNKDMKRIIRRTPPKKIWNQLSNGDEISIYQFGEDFFIPATDVGGHHWGKWVFLGFGSTPIMIFIVLQLYLMITSDSRVATDSSNGPTNR